MSYPYGGGNPGYGPPGGGYPQQGGYPGGPPQPGYPQQQPGYGNVTMPTVESASAAAYSGAPGGAGYPTGPGQGLGFDAVMSQGMGGQPGGGYGPPQGGGYGPPQTAPYGAPQAPPPAMPQNYGPPQPQYQSSTPAYGSAPGYNPPPQGGGYGAPPQAGGYNQPPQQPPQSYGASAPPAGSYGAPPQQGGYGAPTSQPGGYGQPAGQSYCPPQQSQPMGQNYGQPQQSQQSQPPRPQQQPYVQKTQGTLRPAPNFNAENDANILRKAMKGFGTDEKAIIDVLAFRTGEQRQQIKTMFKTMFGKDLIKELKSELGGKFEDVVIALMMPWDEFDAYELKRAMKGVGTDEDAMIEILCSRTNKQIKEINDTYKRLYKKKLEDDIISDTSGHFKRLMVSMANGGRMENQPVDTNKATQDAQRLLQAGEKRLGTDESTFNAIMASQSYEQLRAVFDAYQKAAGRDIEQSVKSEMSGNLEIGMLAIIRCVKNRPAYFAQKLYHSMKGLGTDDRTLIRIIVTRAEVDMVQIKQEFQKLYGKSLDQFIREDTSGDYRKVLVALVAQGGY